MGQARKRTRLFIAKKFQIRYISLILIFMFVIVMLTGYMVYVTTWLMFGEKLAAVYPQGLLLDIVKQVNMVLFLRLIILTPLVILIGLLLSNRIAGPIYRIKRYLVKMASGSYEKPLQLRGKDELQDLAGAVNHLVARLRSEKTRRSEKVDEIREDIEGLREAVDPGRDEGGDILQKIPPILDKLNRLR